MEAARRDDIPLSEYAIIGDGVTAALVARDGAIDWLCHGRFDGPAVFCRLLDKDRGGYFQVAPAAAFQVRRRYVGRTNVLETEFECPTGRLRLTDVMPLGMEQGSLLLRRLEGLSGNVGLRVEFAPTFDFARGETRVELCPGGCVARGAEQQVLRLSSPVPMRVTPGAATASFQLRAGETRWLVLTHGAPPLDDTAAERALTSTQKAWERWSACGNHPGPYADVLRRSALVLKLLIHSPTGAMVAAPTTSLPEEPGGERNWDYRFTWLRDSSWLVSALMDLGYHDESMAFIGWLESLNLVDGWPSIFYDLDGRPPADESELPHLRGYLGSRPVRVGNAASAQQQHDVFGEVVAAIHMCYEAMPAMRPLRSGLWGAVSALADQALARCNQPDHGMWEVRDRPRHFVSSKLLCWTALDRAIAMGHREGLSGRLAAWESGRARLRDVILTAGFDAGLGAFRRALGESELDAASLLLPRYGILPADDPRFVSTVKLIRERLSSRGLLRRYLGADGLHGGEGAFAACSFWLVDCLARQGQIDEARGVFDHVVSHANDLGLLSEELDTETGALLGNYPQALTHLALIRAAVAIAEAERRSAGGGSR